MNIRCKYSAFGLEQLSSKQTWKVTPERRGYIVGLSKGDCYTILWDDTPYKKRLYKKYITQL